MTNVPTVVAHADWSILPAKRWVATAHLRGDGYVADAPRSVGDARRLIASLVLSPSATILAGFDFPIGVPTAYARVAGVRRFRALLDGLGAPPWDEFAKPARVAAEISLHRPFYPEGNGRGTRKDDLVEAFRATRWEDLLRECDRGQLDRPAAECLFWTLGPKQVGRAALTGWTEVLRPALAEGARLWPFDGALEKLLQEAGCVVAETYPADAVRLLNLELPSPRGGKRDPRYRQRVGRSLVTTAETDKAVRLSPALREVLLDGFGPDPNGEDPFDAVIGLLAMLEVVLERRPDGAPLSAAVREVEGWMLGYVVPESAHATDKTSVPPEPASRDWPLPELLPSRLTGAEPAIDDGRPVPGLTVLDFWRWAASDLADNVVRGWFAEFIVAAALGTHDGVRQSWDTVDVKTKAGKTIQVKCSAYLQSWAQKKLSQVNFSVKPARAWDQETGTREDRAGRHADVYVFVHQKHMDKATLDPLDLTQLDFYVVPTSVVEARWPGRVRVSLAAVREAACPIRYAELRREIEAL